MTIEIDDELLVNNSSLCATEARWRLENELPTCSRVVAVDENNRVICVICEAFGADMAQLIVDQRSTAMNCGG